MKIIKNPLFGSGPKNQVSSIQYDSLQNTGAVFKITFTAPV